jgi:hypothetical protein
MRKIALIVCAFAAALLIASPITTGKSKPKPKQLHAALSGSEEAPSGTGDPDGYGAAFLEVQGRNICFRIIAKQISPATAGHIHKGDVGQDGPISVPLFTGTVPSKRKCVKASSNSVAKDIRRNPGDYYVNVHTADFPDGAIRGQLTK